MRMQKKPAGMGLRRPAAIAGLSIVLAASFVVLTACASTFSDAAATGREIHSMTPCGMMMDAMMEHGSVGQTGHDEGGGTSPSGDAQTAPESETGASAHSH
jgi:hypothetical protein